MRDVDVLLGAGVISPAKIEIEVRHQGRLFGAIIDYVMFGIVMPISLTELAILYE